MTQSDVPDSHTLHRRDRMRGIILPMAALTALIALVLLIMVIAFQPHQVSLVGTCMSIMLVLPCLVGMLLLQLVLVGMVWGTSWLYGRTGLWMGKARNVALRGRILTVRVSQAVSRPVISMNAAFTQLETTAHNLRNTFRRSHALPETGEQDGRE